MSIPQYANEFLALVIRIRCDNHGVGVTKLDLTRLESSGFFLHDCHEKKEKRKKKKKLDSDQREDPMVSDPNGDCLRSVSMVVTSRFFSFVYRCFDDDDDDEDEDEDEDDDDDDE